MRWVRPSRRDYAANGTPASGGSARCTATSVSAGPGARFNTAFARRRLIAEDGISWMLPRLVGHSRAMNVLLSGRMAEPQEAHRTGLIDRLVGSGSVLDAAKRVRETIAPRAALRSRW